jgi:hypothetical protein
VDEGSVWPHGPADRTPDADDPRRLPAARERNLLAIVHCLILPVHWATGQRSESDGAARCYRG